MPTIKPRTLLWMVALWAGYLGAWIAFHHFRPNDPWVAKVYHPSFLIVAPLLMGLVPWIGQKQRFSPGATVGWWQTPRLRIFVASWLWLVGWFLLPSMSVRVHGSTSQHDLSYLITQPLFLAALTLIRAPSSTENEAEGYLYSRRFWRVCAWIELVVGFISVGGLLVCLSYATDVLHRGRPEAGFAVGMLACLFAAAIAWMVSAAKRLLQLST